MWACGAGGMGRVLVPWEGAGSCISEPAPTCNPRLLLPCPAQAKDLQSKYEKKMKMLRDDMELRRKQVRVGEGEACGAGDTSCGERRWAGGRGQARGQEADTGCAVLHRWGVGDEEWG